MPSRASREIGGDAGDQSVAPAAVERQNALLKRYLSAGMTVYLDSTNVEPHVRLGLVERARRHGRPAMALRFLPDLSVCLDRNGLRPANRRVPEDIVRRQHRHPLPRPRPRRRRRPAPRRGPRHQGRGRRPPLSPRSAALPRPRC
ncbi:AAA family ATPase [Streptomyces sp. NPDC050703]|uniref:AAA family ATPase n=1 Tax=Streptomyces sp. NPDC050703 TaxID=3157218 RepID=UPI003431E30A